MKYVLYHGSSLDLHFWPVMFLFLPDVLQTAFSGCIFVVMLLDLSLNLVQVSSWKDADQDPDRFQNTLIKYFQKTMI